MMRMGPREGEPSCKGRSPTTAERRRGGVPSQLTISRFGRQATGLKSPGYLDREKEVESRSVADSAGCSILSLPVVSQRVAQARVAKADSIASRACLRSIACVANSSNSV
jgi:hypothetical protein